MRFALRGTVSVVGLVWLLIAMACDHKPAYQPKDKSMPEKTIEAVLKEHTERLMSHPGVVGTAQGECAGKPCIKVYVVKKTPDLMKQIPSDIDGYAVVIQETGDIRALDPG
jgi:DhnA family fructose-bisphosphate aldolase class Ia